MNIQSVLDRSRQLVRLSGLEPEDAAATAVDELAEYSSKSFSEAELLSRAKELLIGFGPIQALMEDDSVEEIWLNRPGELFYFDAEGKHRIEIDLDQQGIQSIVAKMLRHSKRRVDRLTPFVDADLEDGSRLHVVIPEITRLNWSVNIRKFKRSPITLSDLEAAGTISATQLARLRGAALDGESILVSGATQAGKTTLLTALLMELGDNERIVSCEDTFEIAIEHPDWVAMQTRPSSVEGEFAISLRELVRQALRMRPSRLVIGEVRGAEALDLLVALNSGIPGMGTIHARCALGALEKLRLLPLLAGENITEKFLTPTIRSSVNLIAHCDRLPDGSRRVSELLEVSDDLVF